MDERKDYGLGKVSEDFRCTSGDFVTVLYSLDAIQTVNKFNI